MKAPREQQHLGGREPSFSLSACGAVCLTPAERWVTSCCHVAMSLLPTWALFTPHRPPFMEMPFSVPGDPADTDYTAVGCAITTISSNLTEMSKGVKLLAALMDDDLGSGEDLLRAARTLAGAVSDLLKAVQPTSGEVSSWAKQSLRLCWDRCSLWVPGVGLFLPSSWGMLSRCRVCSC